MRTHRRNALLLALSFVAFLLVDATQPATAAVGEGAVCVANGGTGTDTSTIVPMVTVESGAVTLDCANTGPLAGSHTVTWIGYVPHLVTTTPNPQVGCGVGVGGAFVTVDGTSMSGRFTLRHHWPDMQLTGTVTHGGRDYALVMELMAVPPSTPPCTSGSTALAGSAVFGDSLPGPSPFGLDGVHTSVACNGPVLFEGSVYPGVSLVLRAATGQWMVCLRLKGSAADLGSAYLGGAFVVRVGTVPSTGVPTVDTGSCSGPGNTVPGPHPLLNGFVGDPDEPTYVPYMLDTFSAPGTAALCIRVGTAALRVVIPTHTTVQASEATFFLDPFVAGPPVPPPPPTTPSGECRRGDPPAELVNGTILASHLWLASKALVSGPALVCVRLNGPLGTALGGYLKVDSSGTAPPTVTTAVDATPCTSTIVHNTSPLLFNISRSPTGVTPASVCVTVASTSQRITVTPSSGNPPVVTWTPDPGTPG